jgi:hypothetical protein
MTLSDFDSTTQGVGDEGFWRLPYDHLSAILARRDLGWEVARVYLALGYLTIGYRKERDVVSIGQIAELSHVEHRHTVRALGKLKAVGLYDEERLSPKKIIRWIIFPPPAAGITPPADSARQGTIPTVADTTKDSAKRSALEGTKDSAKRSASQGTHPDTQNRYPELPTAGGDTSKQSKRQSKPQVEWSESELRFIVPPVLLAAWKRDYPHLDVEQEIRKAGNYHTQERKWKSRFGSALVRWLNRATTYTSANASHAAGSRFAPAAAGSGTNYNHLAKRFPTEPERAAI